MSHDVMRYKVIQAISGCRTKGNYIDVRALIEALKAVRTDRRRHVWALAATNNSGIVDFCGTKFYYCTSVSGWLILELPIDSGPTCIQLEEVKS